MYHATVEQASTRTSRAVHCLMSTCPTEIRKSRRGRREAMWRKDKLQSTDCDNSVVAIGVIVAGGRKK